jgi:hypothetical protein
MRAVHQPARRADAPAGIEGPGAIQHIWITVDFTWWRSLVLRMYWDDEATPSIEAPLGDFFANGWCTPCNITSLPVAVNPKGGFNSYWEMPFRRSARITIENLLGKECGGFFYQITYTLTDVPEDAAYLHAQWRRSNPLPYQTVHTLLEGVQGRGTTWAPTWPGESTTAGWWGEGEIKFYLTATATSPRSAGPARRTTSRGLETSSTRRASTASSPHPIPGCPRSSSRMGCTAASSASACTAGTSWTPSASSRTCA